AEVLHLDQALVQQRLQAVVRLAQAHAHRVGQFALAGARVGFERAQHVEERFLLRGFGGGSFVQLELLPQCAPRSRPRATVASGPGSWGEAGGFARASGLRVQAGGGSSCSGCTLTRASRPSRLRKISTRRAALAVTSACSPAKGPVTTRTRAPGRSGCSGSRVCRSEEHTSE